MISLNLSCFDDGSTPDASLRVLNLQLSELEKYGIVGKTIFPVVPPKVEYSLTDKENHYCL